MGWLQGLRLQNNKQLLESLSAPRIATFDDIKPEIFHDEHAQTKEEQEKDGKDTTTTSEAGSEQHQSGGKVKREYHGSDVPNDVLPFVSKAEVMSKRSGAKVKPDRQETSEDEEIWIVVDNIVYDCSRFLADHPGGQQVIRSFVGEDCSWQFWRFHGQNEMTQHGRPLRIGRTAGVPNRFAEVRRYVGLSRNGNDEW